MVEQNNLHTLREHLALISTEVYLLLRSTDETDRINRYNTVQEQIDAILELTDERTCTLFSDRDCCR
ncbi:MAG: hypothetical protein LCI00_28025 [Chloroflexi bacterium]|nr:hypothetical protein [Chloroflexota bacterium]MCC6893905.1 hypothetical protein [Anaerolineae bacterium]